MHFKIGLLKKLKKMDTTDTVRASYLALHLASTLIGGLELNLTTEERIAIFAYGNYMYIFMFTVDTTFSSLGFLSIFPLYNVAAKKEVTNQPSVEVEIITY